MKALVATKERQGWRKDDFCHCNEGEFVTWGFECDGERADMPCACRRSLVGFDTSRATTTFKVVTVELTPEGLAGLLEGKLTREGWLSPEHSAEENGDFLMGQVEDTVRLWAGFAGCPDGAVVERRGDRFLERATKPVPAGR